MGQTMDVMTGWAMDIVSSFLRTDETLDVIVVGLWMLLGITIDNIVLGTQTRMLCSQNGLVPGHHHGWAMDVLFSERITRPQPSSWLVVDARLFGSTIIKH